MKVSVRKIKDGMKNTPLFGRSLGVIFLTAIFFISTVFLFVNVIEDTQSRVTSIRIDALQSGLIEFLPDALGNREYTLDKLVNLTKNDPTIGNIRVIEFIENKPIISISFEESEIGKVADGLSSVISLSTTDPGKSFTVRSGNYGKDVLISAKSFSFKDGRIGVLVITHIPSNEVASIDTNMSSTVLMVTTMSFILLVILFWHLKMFSQISLFNEIKDSQEQKYDFIKIVSRALKSPILSIREKIGELSVLISGNDNSKRVLSVIDNLNENMSNLVDDMLEAIRLRQETVDFYFENINPGMIIEDTILAFSEISQKDNIRVSHDISTDRHINVDKFRLKKSILNILSFISERIGKDGLIHIKTSVNMELLTISICDSGGPISSKDQKRMFKQFFGQDENNSKHVGSVQIQLWIAYESIKQMGGILNVSSDSKGATFSINFPVQEKN